jgi:hypothetical protein
LNRLCDNSLVTVSGDVVKSSFQGATLQIHVQHDFVDNVTRECLKNGRGTFEKTSGSVMHQAHLYDAGAVLFMIQARGQDAKEASVGGWYLHSESPKQSWECAGTQKAEAE